MNIGGHAACARYVKIVRWPLWSGEMAGTTCLEGLKSPSARRYLSRMNKSLTPRERAARYRKGLKARGLHRVQMVIPDLRAPAVQTRLRAACAKLSAEPEDEEMRALAAISDAAWANTPE
jgi:hypothetical protein